VNPERMLAVARIALSVCGPNGYFLSGSLALAVHGVAGSRLAEDIDLFSDEVQQTPVLRTAIIEALASEGYRILEIETRGWHPLAQCYQYNDLLFTHPEHGTVTVQLARMPRFFEPSLVDGMPVAGIGQLLYAKLETTEHRLAAKDFIDLHVLSQHLNQNDLDSYLADYTNGIARLRLIPDTQVREAVYVRLSQVAEIPDAAFVPYGLGPETVVSVRAGLLAWADRIAPAEINQRRLDPAVAAGLETPGQKAMLDTLARLAGPGSLPLMTDPQLSNMRGEVMELALATAEGIGRTVELRPDGTPVVPERTEAMGHVEVLVQEVQRITQEIERRTRLSPRQRAEEAAVRRAVAERRDADEAAQHGGAWRLPHTDRRSRHAEAEEETRHHRPTSGPGYGGARR